MQVEYSSSWVADFETTTETDYIADGRVRCYLWRAESLATDEAVEGNDTASFIEFCKRKDVKTVWFFNLKFDGSFILNEMLGDGWEHSPKQVKGSQTYSHIVTGQGQWMMLKLQFGKHVCQILDAAKKFPGISLEDVARTYGIQGKADMSFTKRRPMDYIADKWDLDRVRGDTRILKVAMNDLYARGFTKMTMASDAKAFFNRQWMSRYSTDEKGRKAWNRTFPKLTQKEDDWLRPAYKGGFVYVNPKWAGKDVHGVTVYDVNSMYPAQMRYKALPVGRPVMRAPEKGELYVVSFDAIFDLKKGYLPTIQSKESYTKNEAEYMTTSNGMWHHLNLTCIEYDLFKEHYDVHAEQGHEYMCFRSEEGIFNEYIDYWMKEKERCSVRNDKGERDEVGRATAKRFLNSLYGKTGENPVKQSKSSYIDESGVLRWVIEETEGSAWYLPMATFITAYARCFIISSAQKFGEDFIYADTDSIHCLNAEEHEHLIDIDATRLGAWDKEHVYAHGRYLRPKTYMHYEIANINNGYCYNVIDTTMAGVPDSCRDQITWENFHKGVTYTGKLMSRQVPGGVCLIATEYHVKVN